MSELDVQLLLTAIGSVLLLVALIVSRIRLHPLLALLIVSIAVGLVAGMDTGSVVKATINGAGKTLGAVGLIIALGAMLGKILANAGVTEAIADAILRRASEPGTALGDGACLFYRRHSDVFRGRPCRRAASYFQCCAQA